MSHGLVNFDNTGVADKVGTGPGLTVAQEAKTPVAAKRAQLKGVVERGVDADRRWLMAGLLLSSRRFAQVNLATETTV